MSEIDSLLKKAERSFRAAEGLLRTEDTDFAVSRAYYGCFYVAVALLRTRGLRFSKHGQVIAQYGLLFSKTGLLDPAFHRLLDRAFSLRQVGDYQTEVRIESETITDLIQEGRRFLAAAARYIGDLEP